MYRALGIGIFQLLATGASVIGQPLNKHVMQVPIKNLLLHSFVSTTMIASCGHTHPDKPNHRASTPRGTGKLVDNDGPQELTGEKGAASEASAVPVIFDDNSSLPRSGNTSPRLGLSLVVDDETASTGEIAQQPTTMVANGVAYQETKQDFDKQYKKAETLISANQRARGALLYKRGEQMIRSAYLSMAEKQAKEEEETAKQQQPTANPATTVVQQEKKLNKAFSSARQLWERRPSLLKKTSSTKVEERNSKEAALEKEIKREQRSFKRMHEKLFKNRLIENYVRHQNMLGELKTLRLNVEKKVEEKELPVDKALSIQCELNGSLRKLLNFDNNIVNSIREFKLDALQSLVEEADALATASYAQAKLLFREAMGNGIQTGNTLVIAKSE